MRSPTRLAALTAVLALGVWVVAAADSRSADDKNQVKNDILKLAQGKGGAKAEDIAKAELGDVMQLFKPRPKGGVGIGPVPGAIKPDGIELKLIDLGKKRPLGPADVAKQADPLAEAGEITGAIADVAQHYANKEGKKSPAKWKQY